MKTRVGCLLFFVLGGYCHAQTNLAAQKALDLGDGIKMEFVLVSPGSFLMGSKKGEGNETPEHKVTITKPFYMAKYEVTQEQWNAVAGSNPSNFKGQKNPVESIASWSEVQGFLAQLRKKTAGTEVRLPTEAEWEYACRAGGVSNEFCYGNDEGGFGEYAWFASNSGNSTHPVGEKTPNRWGLYDMHGNVWELCSDWLGPYGGKPAINPTGPKTGSARVCRGGSWSNSPGRGRSAYRGGNPDGERLNNVGLRVVFTARQ